jgi:protein N-terminal amidase
MRTNWLVLHKRSRQIWWLFREFATRGIPSLIVRLTNSRLSRAQNYTSIRMNWLNPPEELPPSLRPRSPGPEPKPPRETGPDIATLNYWASRLTPLHDPAPGYSPDGSRDGQGEGRGKEVVFVACNRVGVEKGQSEEQAVAK